MKIVIGAGSVLVAFVLGVTMIAAGPGFGSPPSVVALEEIPPDLLPVYMAAAGTCPGLPWPVLAGI